MCLFAHLVPISSDFSAPRAARDAVTTTPALSASANAAPTQLGKKFAQGEISSCIAGQLALFATRPGEKKSRTKRRPGDPVRRFLL
jgi:hypothetical protein